ncbi:HEAT repeat domain-containing protein [Kitasatospora sp. NPDC004289]
MRASDARAFTHRQLDGWTDGSGGRSGHPHHWAARTVLEKTDELAARVAGATTDPVTRASVYVTALLTHGWSRHRLAALGMDPELLDAGDAAIGHINRIRRFPAAAAARAALVHECWADPSDVYRAAERRRVLAKADAGRPGFATPDTVRRLIADLDSEDPLVLAYAATALGVLRAPEAVGPLLDAWARLVGPGGKHTGPVSALRMAAVRSLRPEHLPLVARVLSEPTPEARSEEDRAWETEALWGHLADFLRAQDDPAARAALDRYEAGVERKTRARLGRLADEQPPAGRGPFVRWLIDRVAEKPLQGEYIQALGKYGDVSALPVLTVALGHEHGAVQARADRAIQRIGGRAARREAVLTVLRDPDSLHRRAAYAAGRMGLAEAVPLLLASLRSGRREVEEAAIASLARLGAVEAVPDILALPLTTTIGHRNELHTRLLALRRLGPVPGADPTRLEDLAIDAIRRTPPNGLRESIAVRDLATDVLALCDSPRATDLVVQTLVHGTVRASLVRPLAERGDPALVDLMAHLVRCAPDRRIRRLATEGILRAAHHPQVDLDRFEKQMARLGDATTRTWLEPRLPERPGRLHRLCEATHHQEPRVRAQAVKSLALVGGPQALELIAKLREDPSRHVRACVAGALRRTNPPA